MKSLDRLAERSLDLPEPLGQSEAFLAFHEQISRLAGVPRPVLIVGERGTGKELAAARLHYLSPRWEEDFVHLNCAALSENLLESELFGHEAGSFTGAVRRREGRFEAATGGTLFLDEIGQTPMSVQEKILRAVEYGKIQRIGSNEEVRVDTRIIGATHADLPGLVKTGKFKADLLDRLSFEVLVAPPLREREGDVELLAEYFIRRITVELDREMPPVLGDRALEQLYHYDWPGNVRELKNVVERAVFRSENGEITELCLDPFPVGEENRAQNVPETVEATDMVPDETHTVSPEGSGFPLNSDKPFEEQCAEFELALLRQALEVCKFHQKRAADRLGLTYHQFRGLYRKYRDHLDGK